MEKELVLLITMELLVPLALGLLWIAIKREFEKRDKKDDRIAELLAQQERRKEEAIMDWRGRFEKTLCAVKGKVAEI